MVATNSLISNVITDMSLNRLNNVSDHTLQKQTEMNAIINDETNRLEDKQQTVDDMIDSKERMIQLNSNFIARKQEYQKMMIAIIIGLAVCIILYTINNFLPIPSAIISIILIITFVGVFIYCFTVYTVIANRDHMDFEKIIMKSPVIPVDQQGQRDQTNSSGVGGSTNLLGSLTAGMCIGSSCCSVQTIWDTSKNLCVKGPVESFEPLLKVNADSFNVIKQNVKSPQSFTPNEFDEYSSYFNHT